MNSNTVAVLFGVAVALGYGVADFWGARAAKKIGPVTALVAIDLLLLVIYAPLYSLLPESELPLTSSGVSFAIAGGLVLNVASLLFFKALAAGPVSIVSSISGAYPLVSALLAVAVFGARLSWLQVGAIVLIVAGVMAVAGFFNSRLNKGRSSRGPLLSLFSVAFYGIAFSCLGQAATRIGWQYTTLIEFVTLAIAVALSVPLIRGNERVFSHLRSALGNRFVISGSIAAVLTIAAFNMGFMHEQTSGAIIIAVSACYPVVTVALALHQLKERLNATQVLGVIASIAGVVILSVG